MSNNEYADLMRAISEVSRPLSDKLDKIVQDMATRSEVKDLRQEIAQNYMRRDALEPQLEGLRTQISGLNSDLKGTYLSRDLYEAKTLTLSSQVAVSEASIRTTNTRIDILSSTTEIRFREIEARPLSDRDRNWLRWNQIGGLVVVAIAILQYLHVLHP